VWPALLHANTVLHDRQNLRDTPHTPSPDALYGVRDQSTTGAWSSATKSAASADVHDTWSAWISRSEPHHEAIRPYDQLAPSVQKEDAPFLIAIRHAARARAEGR
jgi:hypothetical protein